MGEDDCATPSSVKFGSRAELVMNVGNDVADLESNLYALPPYFQMH